MAIFWDDLGKLAGAIGVSGDEGEVRGLILEALGELEVDVSVDKLGNIIAKCECGIGAKTVMICAHMDEIGFMVSDITKEGYLKFKPVGGIDPRIMPGKRVFVGDERIPGVVGVKPKHLKKDENDAPEFKKLYIDLGAGRDVVEKKVQLGDYISFGKNYARINQEIIKSKALDDRVGCAILLDVLRENFPYNICAVFTVQEEVGCRGAKAAMFGLETDFALVLEGTTCSDAEKEDLERGEFSTRLGHGPAISIVDGGCYSDKAMVGQIVGTARDKNIPWQYKQTMAGGNDSSTIHIAKGGFRTAAISVPCRYIHSPASMCSVADIEACRELVKTLLREERLR